MIKTKLKKMLIIALVAILSVLASYGIVGFVYYEFNPFFWKPEIRFVAIFLTAIFFDNSFKTVFPNE